MVSVSDAVSGAEPDAVSDAGSGRAAVRPSGPAGPGRSGVGAQERAPGSRGAGRGPPPAGNVPVPGRRARAAGDGGTRAARVTAGTRAAGPVGRIRPRPCPPGRPTGYVPVPCPPARSVGDMPAPCRSGMRAGTRRCPARRADRRCTRAVPARRADRPGNRSCRARRADRPGTRWCPLRRAARPDPRRGRGTPRSGSVRRTRRLPGPGRRPGQRSRPGRSRLGGNRRRRSRPGGSRRGRGRRGRRRGRALRVGGGGRAVGAGVPRVVGAAREPAETAARVAADGGEQVVARQTGHRRTGRDTTHRRTGRLTPLRARGGGGPVAGHGRTAPGRWGRGPRGRLLGPAVGGARVRVVPDQRAGGQDVGLRAVGAAARRAWRPPLRGVLFPGVPALVVGPGGAGARAVPGRGRRRRVLVRGGARGGAGVVAERPRGWARSGGRRSVRAR